MSPATLKIEIKFLNSRWLLRNGVALVGQVLRFNFKFSLVMLFGEGAAQWDAGSVQVYVAVQRNRWTRWWTRWRNDLVDNLVDDLVDIRKDPQTVFIV